MMTMQPRHTLTTLAAGAPQATLAGAVIAFLCALVGPSALAVPAAELIRLRGPQSRLSAYVAPALGGALVGLELQRQDGPLELLHRGRDFSPTSDWDGKAPILWPATGRTYLAGGEETQPPPGWSWSGRDYAMPLHGFARDLPWRVVRRSRTSALLSLSDSEQTRRIFPFGFRLTTEYRINGGTLSIRQRVRADRGNIGAMPFSIGNHITFRVPLTPRGDARRVMISTPATRQLPLDTWGRPTGEVVELPFTEHPVPSLPTRSALSLGGYAPERTWVRLTDPAGLTVTVSHREDRRPEGTPVLFNLWGDAGAGFFSPEPWVGKQNALATGDGVLTLKPGEQWSWTITVLVEDQAGAMKTGNSGVYVPRRTAAR
jgi:galactose mutarotase-like enzyme